MQQAALSRGPRVARAFSACRNPAVNHTAQRLDTEKFLCRSFPGDYATSATSSPVDVAERLRGRSCLVQGASRGLGLEYVRQLLAIPDTTVVATCRDPSSAVQLQRLAAEAGTTTGSFGTGPTGSPSRQVAPPPRLRVVQMDVCDDDSIQAAASSLSSELTHLDLLINCSAVLHGPKGMAPETSYSRIRADHMALAFATNAIGPMLVSRAMLPLLLRSPTASEAAPALIANMSARVGSISDNRLGGWYAYRGSKAALNQMTKTLALELSRRRAPACVLALHPGTCDTDLSRPWHKNVPAEKLFSQERGVRQLLQILAGATTADSGRFVAWDGQDVPW